MLDQDTDRLPNTLDKKKNETIHCNWDTCWNKYDPDISNPSQDKLYSLQQKFETQSKTLMNLNDTLQNISQ